MQSDLYARWLRPRPPEAAALEVGSRAIHLQFVSDRRARRYILRVKDDGSVRITVPRGGTKAYALDFARSHSRWIEEQLGKQAARAQQIRPWSAGTEVLIRGEACPLIVNPRGDVVQLADQHIPVPAGTGDLRPFVEAHLWALAEKELVPRTWQMAAEHQLQISRVRVRNQRSRWGSCSVRGTICLNWRLIQAPAEVRDYLIIHELMHLHEMNHSARFWKWVQAACPNYHRAEQWLNQYSDLLRPASGKRPSAE